MAGIRKFSVRIPQFIEKGMDHRFDCRESLCRRVLEKPRDQIDGVLVGLTENLSSQLARPDHGK
jgi:hypothetical protein